MLPQAVYGVLKEAEHRSTFYIPYWDLPFADKVVPRQIEFRKDIKVELWSLFDTADEGFFSYFDGACLLSLWLHCLQVINDCLDELIELAKATKQEDDLEALQARDYSKVMHDRRTLCPQHL